MAADVTSLNFIAPTGSTGYGVTGFNLYTNMIDLPWRVHLFDLGHNGRRKLSEVQQLEIAHKNALTNFAHDGHCLKLWHQNDLALKVGTGKYVGFPIFELDNFTQQEKHHLNYPDELFVCSKWAADILGNYTTKKVHVIPLGIDPNIFFPREVAKKDKTVRFLNMGKWEVRKGHDLLINIFNKAFGPQDDVELHLLPFNPFLPKEENKKWENLYTKSPLGNKIKIWGWQDSHQQIAELISVFDCGIFPSRAEGWNLELLEMMAMGKPVIATNYSAHTEFCTQDNSMLIDIQEVEPAYDGKWFFEQGNWAKLGNSQIDQAVEYMRLVYNRCNREGTYINDAGISTGQEFTWKKAAQKIYDFFIDVPF